MLGKALSAALVSRGYLVRKLVRRVPQASDEIQWNPDAPHAGLPNSSSNPSRPAHSGLDGITAAIHLSGANVASRRWTSSFKREIAHSRIHSTAALSQTLAGLAHPPQVLISASAVGFYGNRGDAMLDESSSPGAGFFPDLCTAWEEAALPASKAGIRVVHPRFGVVLGKKGGALDRLRTLFGLGLGGRLGNGRQWMSWVSEADAVSAILYAIEHPNLAGPLNITAPYPVTNADFTRQLAEHLHRPALMTAPAFALRLAFGEMANEALLASVRALPRRLMEAGFVFQHPTLQSALSAVIPN